MSQAKVEGLCDFADTPQQQTSALAPGSPTGEAIAERLAELELRLDSQIQQTKEYSVQEMDMRFWANFAYTTIVYLVALSALYPHIRPWLYRSGLLQPCACIWQFVPSKA